MTHRRRLVSRGTLLLCALVAWAGLAAHAEGEGATAKPKPGGPGAVLYLTYCESCHGVAGLGDGPAAGSLRTPPADLTQLWTRYGTPLDRERLARYIDGRMLFSIHGPREMPIWGEEFFEGAPGGTPGLEEARHRLIEVLVDHLQRLQREQAT